MRPTKAKSAVKTSPAGAKKRVGAKGAEGGDEFKAVSEEEMDEEEEKDAGGDGSKRVRVVKKTTRKTKTETVQEGGDDERVAARDEEREETMTTTRGPKGAKPGAAVTTTSVRGSRSTLQSDGTTATSAYSTIANQDPIPLDDLLTGSAVPAGGRKGLTNRNRGAVERPMENDLDPVSGELDLLSLASRPNVVYVQGAQPAAGAELDMLTGQPVVTTVRTRVVKTRTAPVPAAAPAPAAVPQPRKAAAPRPAPRAAAPAPAPTTVSSKRQQLLAQLAALEGEEGAGEEQGGQPEDDLPPEDYLEEQPEVRAPPPRAQPASRGSRSAPAPAPRAVARPPPRAVEEPVYDEYAGQEEEDEYEEPALLDRLPPSAAPTTVLRPTSGGGVSISAPRPVSGASVDLWQHQGGLMDLDHLGANSAHATPSSRAAKPRRGGPAVQTLSMAEMQSQSSFPSMSSIAMSDDSLTSAFSRKPQQSRAPALGAGSAARGNANAGLSMGDFAPVASSSSSQRGRQPPASTDIFFQS